MVRLKIATIKQSIANAVNVASRNVKPFNIDQFIRNYPKPAPVKVSFWLPIEFFAGEQRLELPKVGSHIISRVRKPKQCSEFQ